MREGRYTPLITEGSEHLDPDAQGLGLFIGDNKHASPRFCVKLPNGKEVFIYLNRQEIAYIAAWAASYRDGEMLEIHSNEDITS